MRQAQEAAVQVLILVLPAVQEVVQHQQARQVDQHTVLEEEMLVVQELPDQQDLRVA
jgi:hypothetical protein